MILLESIKKDKKFEKKRSDNSEQSIKSHLSSARFIKFLLRKGLPTDDNFYYFFTHLNKPIERNIMGSNFNNKKIIIFLYFYFISLKVMRFVKNRSQI